MKNKFGAFAAASLASVVMVFSVTNSNAEEYVDIFGNTQTACTRDSLQVAADSYVAAQKAGDASKMALADEAKFFENMEAIESDKGLWNRALPISYTQSFLDPAR